MYSITYILMELEANRCQFKEYWTIPTSKVHLQYTYKEGRA